MASDIVPAMWANGHVLSPPPGSSLERLRQTNDEHAGVVAQRRQQVLRRGRQAGLRSFNLADALHFLYQRDTANGQAQEALPAPTPGEAACQEDGRPG